MPKAQCNLRSQPVRTCRSACLLPLLRLAVSVIENPQRTWPQPLNTLGHLNGNVNESSRHRCRHIEHLHPLWLQTDFGQQFFEVYNAAFGVGITIQVMAVTGQSPGGEDGIRAILKGAQHQQYVQFAGTGQLYHFD